MLLGQNGAHQAMGRRPVRKMPTTSVRRRLLGNGRRQRTRVFSELASHYLLEDRFGRPSKGNDKGKVEGLVGYARRNFLVPVPSFPSFDALNAYLERGAWGGW